jgi:hypothetical protein
VSGDGVVGWEQQRLAREWRLDRSRPGAVGMCLVCGAFRLDGEPPRAHFTGCIAAPK